MSLPTLANYLANWQTHLSASCRKLHLITVMNGTCLVRNSLFDVILKGCLLRSGAFAAGAQIQRQVGFLFFSLGLLWSVLPPLVH
jgi:hypothetical protein